MAAVDCGGASCARERRFTVAELAPFYPGLSLGETVAKLRCAICKGGVSKVKLTLERRGKDTEVYRVKR